MIKMIGFLGISKNYYKWPQGIASLGDSYTRIDDFNPDTIYEADCFYQTNMIKPKFIHGERLDREGAKYLYIKNSNKPVLVSESAPFRKYGGYLRFGWNSYMWTDANCNNNDVDDKRWKKFEKTTGIKINDWNSPGDNIVIMGQKEGDSALVPLFDQGKTFYNWLLETIYEIRKHTDRPIVFRPHPRTATRGIKTLTAMIKNQELKNVSLSENISFGGNQGGAGLDADLDSAHCVVTYNSLSGIEAVEKGIPVFSMNNGSMVYPISHKNLSQIENIKYDIDLQDWKNKIAYTIWNKKEVAGGECWHHLKGVYF
jgi:hypothetical protein